MLNANTPSKKPRIHTSQQAYVVAQKYYREGRTVEANRMLERSKQLAKDLNSSSR